MPSPVKFTSDWSGKFVNDAKHLPRPAVNGGAQTKSNPKNCHAKGRPKPVEHDQKHRPDE